MSNLVTLLLRCDENLLLATLSTRTIQTREGIIIKALDCNGAVSSRDALAKTVYARLFDWYGLISPFKVVLVLADFPELIIIIFLLF